MVGFCIQKLGNIQSFHVLRDHPKRRKPLRGRFQIVNLFPVSRKCSGSNKNCFLVVFGGPGGFRKLREACGNNFHQVSSKSEGLVTSYEEKSEKLYFSRSVFDV